MAEADAFSALVADIYDAVLDPQLWPGVLEQIARFVGGSAAGLLSKNAVSKAGDAHYHFGISDRYLRLYRETYWQFDPLVPLLFYDVGRVTKVSDYIPDSEFRDGRFYKEWVEPQGFVDSANVVLEKSAATCAILSVIRSAADGLIDEGARWRMQLITPHVRRAVLVGNAIDLRSAEAANLADTLDGIAAGMFLVDASGLIVHANAAGHALLSAGEILRAAGGRLVAGDAQTDQIFLDIFTAAGRGDAAVGTTGIAVPLTARDGAHHVAHVLPLTSGARRRAGTAYAAVAAIFVHKAVLATPSPPEVIAKTYSLTPSELRVLLAIVEVGGVPETAAALGVAETTVKFHLRRLFEKTGAKRQADLVKLVAGFGNPFAG